MDLCWVTSIDVLLPLFLLMEKQTEPTKLTKEIMFDLNTSI